MIGKGKAIAHTAASMSYGWNQEKGSEVVYSQHLAGENPKQISQEFKIIQEQNSRCTNNTLSFVLSPTIKDGQKLTQEQLGELTQKFIEQMKLQEHQAIAFVHRNKEHTHVHLYVNRINFQGQAYNDSFIGKRSQLAAEQVAKDMGLTTVKEVQLQNDYKTHLIRTEIQMIHKLAMARHEPKSFDQYIQTMKTYKVDVIPSINKSQRLQGFRFVYKGQSFKGSEVHRSMSGSKLAIQLSNNAGKSILLDNGKVAKMLDKTVLLSQKMAADIARNAIKKAIVKTVKQGFEYGY